ncbi:MAG: alpha/beta fold hydrolase [Actinomycetales bacterium]
MRLLSRSRLAVASALGATLALSACTGGGAQTDHSGGPGGSNVSTASSSPAAMPSASGASTTAGSGDAGDPAKDPKLARFYSQKLAWQPCGEDGGGSDFGCAWLTVPIDYAKPDGPTTRVYVNRLRASNPAHRIGSLIVNPGGPGGSGVQYAAYATQIVSADVRARYDIVGFDPRGVAHSDPIRCLTDKQTDAYLAADGSPDTPAEEQQLIDASQQLGQRCDARNGELLAHVGTRDVVRDLDVLRAVLGDSKLHYLGKSYGTFIGAIYGDLFPTHIGRMVLDGALDPRSTSEEVNLGQAKGFELALSSFLKDCGTRSDCPFRGSEDQMRLQLEGFLARLDRAPLPTDDDEGRKLTQALGVLGIVFAMYDEGFWPQLRTALSLGLRGDGSALLVLADAYADREPDGTYSSNQNDVIYAVNCLDKPEPNGPQQVEQQKGEFEKASPVFGDYIAWSSLPCHYWPVPPEMQPHAVAAPGAPPIVVVGTIRDPATPYQWAVGLAHQLDSGVLLTYNGDGHTAYRRGSPCIDSAVDRYLLEGTPPKDGTRCG